MKHIFICLGLLSYSLSSTSSTYENITENWVEQRFHKHNNHLSIVKLSIVKLLKLLPKKSVPHPAPLQRQKTTKQLPVNLVINYTKKRASF